MARSPFESWKIMISRLVRNGGLTGLTFLLLGGCSLFGITPGTHKVCPAAAILVDTSSMTAFRQDLADDPAGMLYAVDLSGVKTDCSFDKREGETHSSLDLSFRATRAPNGDAANYSVPYYVAVIQGDRIISKSQFTAQFGFAPGASSMHFTDRVGAVEVRLENGKHPYDYEILVGLQLTPAERDYNKKMGRFAQ
jgi:hypothetical protein